MKKPMLYMFNILILCLFLTSPSWAFQNLFVEVNISHPNRSDLKIELGIGDPNNPDFVTTLQDKQTNPQAPFQTNVDQIYDITVNDDSLFPPMPNGDNLYWLRITDDTLGNFGTLTRWCIDTVHNPLATDLACQYSPLGPTLPLEITDGQTTISYIGVDPQAMGLETNPDQQACAGIYGQFTTNQLFAGLETGFYFERSGNTLTGMFTSNVVFGNDPVVGQINGQVGSDGNCYFTVLFAGSAAQDICPVAVAGVFEDFDNQGVTYGRFNFGGGTVCEALFPNQIVELPKVSG